MRRYQSRSSVTSSIELTRSVSLVNLATLNSRSYHQSIPASWSAYGTGYSWQDTNPSPLGCSHKTKPSISSILSTSLRNVIPYNVPVPLRTIYTLRRIDEGSPWCTKSSSEDEHPFRRLQTIDAEKIARQTRNYRSGEKTHVVQLVMSTFFQLLGFFFCFLTFLRSVRM